MDLASAKHLALFVFCLHLLQHILHAAEQFHAEIKTANRLQQDMASTANNYLAPSKLMHTSVLHPMRLLSYTQAVETNHQLLGNMVKEGENLVADAGRPGRQAGRPAPLQDIHSSTTACAKPMQVQQVLHDRLARMLGSSSSRLHG